MNAMPNRTGIGYLTITPDPRYSHELRVVKANQSMPQSTPQGAVVVKVRISVPKVAFGPLVPTVDVEVPESAVIHPETSVEVIEIDPTEEDTDD